MRQQTRKGALGHGRGHALISSLVALGLLGIGGAGSLAWLAELQRLERHLGDREAALRWLQDAQELGLATTCAEAGPHWNHEGRRYEVRHLLLREASGLQPARGHHTACELRWTDPWGRPQSMRLATYIAATGRAY